MNVKILFRSAIALLFPLSANAQTTSNFREDAQLLKKVIVENHFSPRAIDDKFSVLLFDHFINELDPNRMYFTNDDLTSLYKYRQQLDNELNSNGWNFVPGVTALYKKCLERAQSLSTQILQSPVALESRGFYRKDTTWAMNEDDLKKRWSASIQMRTLVHLHDLAKNSKASDKKSLVTLEPNGREKVKPEMARMFRRILNHPSGFDNRVASQYVQAIATAFDPHTSYYQPGAVDEFFSELSSEGYYFGFAINENEKGEIVIEHLTPGGPAWRSGMLHAGDVIRELKWQGQEPIDVAGASADEINAVLQKNEGLLEIKVSQAGDVIQTVLLKKEKRQAEENIVRSYIFSGQGRRLGFISLPGFYSNWGTNEGSRCATDVAREIVKLKKAQIDGLIIDLRLNGGGSMYDAVEMAGIFIDAGPIGAVKEKSGAIISMKDMNRGTIYDGPLVVMINRGSASASEFFAAALQDYNRGIIVGGRSYGKATVQRVLPLKAEPAKGAKSTRVGYAKVTAEKIYRITGKTVQKKGIVPDIAIPDLYDSLDIGEVKSELALPADTITKKIYYTAMPKTKLDTLRSRSLVRVTANKNFNAVRAASGEFAKWSRQSQIIPLDYQAFSKVIERRADVLKTMEAGGGKKLYTIFQNQLEDDRMNIDAFANEVNKTYIAKLEKDLMLEETLNIICDYIKLNPQNK